MLSPSPNTSSVTPWRISPCEFPSSNNVTGDQLSMLMNPGETAMPLASISFFAFSFDRSPINAMVSLLIPISALNCSPPFPSYTIPFRMMVSYNGLLQEHIRKDIKVRASNCFMMLTLLFMVIYKNHRLYRCCSNYSCQIFYLALKFCSNLLVFSYLNPKFRA